MIVPRSPFLIALGLSATLGWALLPSMAFAAEPEYITVELPNTDFERGLEGWVVREKTPMSTVHPDAAYSGQQGLRIIDETVEAGSGISTIRIPVEPGYAYRVTVRARLISGDGVGVGLRLFDQQGKQLNPWPKAQDSVTVQSKEWREFSLVVMPLLDAETLDISLRTYERSVVTVDFDELKLERFKPEVKPPWEGVYKFDLNDPDEVKRLTPADVPAVDGLVYPNWKNVGIPGGIPQDLRVAVGAEAFVDYEGKDIAPLLNEFVRKVGADGGGVIELPEGNFLLEASVIVRDSGVVIRGAGWDKTHIFYQEHIPMGTIRLFCWNPNNIVGPDSFWEVQANPQNLTLLRITSRGVLLEEQQRRDHWGNRFTARLRGQAVLEALGAGRHPIDVEIGYANGDRFTNSFEIEVAATAQPGDTWADQHGAFVIAGSGLEGEAVVLTQDGRRGDTVLHIASGHSFKAGDRIMIEAPSTPRWNKLTGNVTPWGTFRINHYEVAAVEEKPVKDGEAGISVLTISEPLRIDFPQIDGSYVRKIGVVEYSGFEGFTVEQKVFTNELVGPRIGHTLWYPVEDLWTDGITFNYAFRCWVSDVRIINSGRNPLYITRSKQCEVHDVEIDGAIFKGGGGTGYVGFERTFDSLMDGVVTRGMRHAPNVQWGSAGNVIRNGHFTGSDAQWHAGWTHENLYENNTILQTLEDRQNGSYGHAFFASGPASSAHGPQGPRNVVYNNDVKAPLNGVHMVGGNEGWLILHNRFQLDGSQAVLGREKSFDHTIKSNVFVMSKPGTAAIFFASADCTGVDVIDNDFYGPIERIAGFAGDLGEFGRVEDNRVFPLPTTAAELPARPQPRVSSIYEWQRSNITP